jgi:hypothetical protein
VFSQYTSIELLSDLHRDIFSNDPEAKLLTHRREKGQDRDHKHPGAIIVRVCPYLRIRVEERDVLKHEKHLA